MPDPIAVDRATARRFLVRRHLLAPPRSLPPEPASIKTVLGRLGSLQFDPLEVTGRNHDLILAARIAGYRRAWTDALLYDERWLYETYNKGLSLVPTAELPYFRITWDRFAAGHGAATFAEHAELVEELLDRIRRDGPLSSTDVEPRAAIEWYWRPTNQVRAILEAMAQAGILGLAKREGNRRVYDLSERLFPAALLADRRTETEQIRHKLLSRYRAHGLLGARGGQAEVWLGTGQTTERNAARDTLIESGDLVAVEVEGVRGVRYVLGGEVDALRRAATSSAADEPASPGAAFLAPLDPLVWDRDLLRSLWEFDYIWEVYVPAAKRRWGYYVLPLLAGDRFVGRIEPRIDRSTGTLHILDVWWEAGFEPLADAGFVRHLAGALTSHAAFLGADRVALPRTARHRSLVAALRPALGAMGQTAGGRRGPRVRA
ncbi:MAG TPA: crosslink repair DNA glycosylase YcaQ family protein [Candidatus Saccharimonadales bacterium]|nr:crosslink repair DNA glycosylase YcaQ family protein [Candidatus Saccharimonadales bacterium]